MPRRKNSISSQSLQRVYTAAYEYNKNLNGKVIEFLSFDSGHCFGAVTF